MRQAFSHPESTAYKIIDEALSKILDRSTAVIYIDGHDVEEKEGTHAERRTKRVEAAEATVDILEKLQACLDDNRIPPKQLHISAKKNLKLAFHLQYSDRVALGKALESRGWKVKVGDVEADVEIAKDCMPDDIVLTTDSDAIAYRKIKTIWRLIGRRKVLEYNMQDVCRTLSLSRAQLTALAIVSSNDYQKNIPSLGAATNLGIVKKLQAESPEEIVKLYRATPLVLRKNSTGIDFQVPIRVYVQMHQTPTHDDSERSHLVDLETRYKSLCEMHHQVAQLKQKERKQKQTGSPAPAKRHTKRQTFNRYRTVGPPADDQSNAKQKPRYTPKTRQRQVVHDKPDVMKMYSWKRPKPSTKEDDKDSAP
ncbi:hypothetical protein BGX31_004409, partial [Mortierella sp. GBA43]